MVWVMRCNIFCRDVYMPTNINYCSDKQHVYYMCIYVHTYNIIAYCDQEYIIWRKMSNSNMHMSIKNEHMLMVDVTIKCF